MKKYKYQAISPKQTESLPVYIFCAPSKDILSFAEIDRIRRDEKGKVSGFQRPQIANHIKEISHYLEKKDAILPNSIVLAFIEGTKAKRKGNGLYEFEITVVDEPPGLVVDGQQRLSALQSIGDKTFEVMVSAIVCPSEDELRKQFILINNTRPLPKQLIYELLPTVDGLPHRLSSRSTASSLIERLNYDPTSSLCGQIKQHTNPMGTIRDTALQRLCLNSLETGIIRVLMQKNNGLDVSFKLISEFFKAVQEVFPESWYEHNPTTSRLIHGAGITAMGFVMDFLNARNNSTLSKEFKPGLEKLKPHCAWTEGTWNFAKNNIRPWNSLQNLPKDIMELSLYLIRVIKKN